MSTPTSTINADTSVALPPELLKGLSPEILIAVQGFISMVNDGLDVDKFFDIENALAHHPVSAAEADYVKSQPGVAKIFEERYIAPTPDLDELLQLPEDSLGYIYASNLRAAKFEQNFLSRSNAHQGDTDVRA